MGRKGAPRGGTEIAGAEVKLSSVVEADGGRDDLFTVADDVDDDGNDDESIRSD